jgi:hypothetical protein
MGVLRCGPCDGAAALPSGPIVDPPATDPGPGPAGAPATGSVMDAPGGGSSPPLRPQPARPSAATSAPMSAILAIFWSDGELNSGTPDFATA